MPTPCLHSVARRFGQFVAIVFSLPFILNACSSGGGGGGSVSAATLDARAGYSAVTLSWLASGASSYNLYYSSAPNCDIANYKSCPGGIMISGVSSPYTVKGLANDTNYWFKLEAVTGSGSLVSAEVGAHPSTLVSNDVVDAVAQDSNGVTYLGGDFTYIGQRSGYGVPFSTSSGHARAYPLVNGAIYAAAPDGSGGYYIGGAFTQVDGQSFSRLAHIQSDGSLDTGWTPSANGTVLALTVSGSSVYVGGSFTSITDTLGTQPRNYLAVIDTASGNVGSWDPNANAVVRALTVSGTTVYAGGDFTAIGGSASLSYLAAIPASGSGTADTSWAPKPDSSVYALAVDAGGTVYVGGGFANIAGQAITYLAALNTDSSTGAAIADTAIPQADSNVTALAVSGSTVYVGGYFTTIGTQTRYALAAFATDGTVSAWNPNLYGVLDNYVRALTISGKTLYVGGDFTSVDGQARYHLAAFNSDGTLASWNPSTDNTVRALAASAGTVYAGGSFTSIGGAARNRLAAINADGSLGSWNPDADNTVRALAISGTTIYAGGDFTAIGGITHKKLAAIGSDGTLSNTWNPSADGTVYALVVSGNMVYAGGSFAYIDTTLRNCAAAIGTDGTLSNTWDPNADNTVRALAVSGNTIYMGGDFSTIGGTGASRLAAVDDTYGTLDTTIWTPSANSSVRALAVSGGYVYVGGYFTKIGTKTRNRLAAIGIDGTLSNTWDPNANNAVQALVVSGSTVYVGGDFTTMLSSPATVTINRLAAIGADGILNTSWNPNADNTVYALCASTSIVYAGGAFTSIGGEPNPNLVMLAP